MVAQVGKEITNEVGLVGLALLGDDIETLHGSRKGYIKQVEIVQAIAFALFFNFLQCQIAHVLGVLVHFEQHLFQIRYSLKSQVLWPQPFLGRLTGIQLLVQISDGFGIDDHGKLQAFRLMYRHDIHRVATLRLHGKHVLFLVPKRKELDDALFRSRLPSEHLLHEVIDKGVANAVEPENAKQRSTKVIKACGLRQRFSQHTRLANAHHRFDGDFTISNGFHLVEARADIAFKAMSLRQHPEIQHVGNIGFVVVKHQVTQRVDQQLDLIRGLQQDGDLRNNWYSFIVQKVRHFRSIV